MVYTSRPMSQLGPEGQELVLGAAGTGKTNALVERIRYLLLNGESPEGINCISLSDRLVRDKRRRLESDERCGRLARDVFFGTPASFAARILRLAGELPDSKEVPSNLVPGHIMAEQNFRQALVDPADNRPWFMQPTDLERADLTTRWLNDLAGSAGRMPEQLIGSWGERRIRATLELRRQDESPDPELWVSAWAVLEEQTATLRTALSANFRHLLIDEFEEMTPTQFEVLHRLGETSRSILVAADPNEAIYRWRGADPHILQQFRGKFPESLVRPLVQDFRATKKLVVASDVLRSHELTALEDQARIPHHDSVEGAVPVLIRAPGGFENMCTEFAKLLRNYATAYAWSDIAVLARRRSTVDNLVPFLMNADIPVDHLDDPAGEGATAGDAAGVAMGSIHASKGLEWEVVFLLDVSDDVIPGGISSGDKERMQEEERLFYVATTRAKSAMIYLLPTNSVPGFESKPTRFLSHLGEGLRRMRFNQV